MTDRPDNAPDDARPYVWTTDEAVLVHIVRQLEYEGREIVDLAAIRAAVGLGDEESHRVIGRLERDGMIEIAGIGARGMRQGIYVVKAVTGRGLRRAGAWPTEAEVLAEQIIAAFTDAADRESDPAQQSKLHAVVSSFREVEAIPLPDASVDVVISNCVINLSGDKPAVFAEIARVLGPGGRLGVADLITEDEADPAAAAAGTASVGAITGTLTTNGYRDELTAAGLVEATVTPMQQIAEATWSALIHARRPAGTRRHRSDARDQGAT